mgnify:FL=1
MVISNVVNPTVFFWLNKYITNISNPRKIQKNILYDSKTIILVRYVPLNIFFDLVDLKRKSKKIVLLIDDNLLELDIFSELPFLYKLKILLNIYFYKFLFNFFINEIWVTNKVLGEKVKKKISKSKINIKLLKPTYYSLKPQNILYKIAYLGTSSHVKELRWLRPLFEEIQNKRSDCLIEIYVNKKWRNYFRAIPRMKMIFPMDWETFYMDTSTRKVDLVLNPILSGKFNKFRSPTKFFDTTRLGAVGLYSNIEPFSDFINNNTDGILLDNNVDIWIEKICFLLENKDVRKVLYLNALKRSEKFLI